MKVLVYTENWDGKFKKSTFELVSYAAAIAKHTETELVALSIGVVEDDELKQLGKYGASRILNVSDSRLKNLDSQVYASIIAEAVGKENAEVVVISNSNTSKAIGPRLSVKLKAGLVYGVTALPSEYVPFTVRKKVYHGKAFADVVVKSEIKIISLAQNSYGIEENETSVTVENFVPVIDDATFKIKVTDVQKATGKILLNDAEIIVSGGRGMKGPENWKPLEELAEILGAALACSRPVSDEGWRPHSEHVGQTGKIVAPNIYFACGISGAIQHLAGVSSSKVIVAINTDNDAPVFQAADYGVIADVRKALPKLTEAFRKFKE